MTERLGTGRAMLAVVLAGALVTYGGVSLFVAFFVLAPMAEALFPHAAIPRRLMPGGDRARHLDLHHVGAAGDTGDPECDPDAVSSGTTPFAAPGLGVIASAVMLGFGLWWLGRAAAAAQRRGEGFGNTAPVPSTPPPRIRWCVSGRRRPTPSIRRRSTIRSRAKRRRPSCWQHLPLIVVIAVNLLMSFAVLPRMDTAFLAEPRWGALRFRLSAACGRWPSHWLRRSWRCCF